MSRADDLEAAHDAMAAIETPGDVLHLCRVADVEGVIREHAAIPDLLAVLRAADKHCEDCCRVDVTLQEVLASANRLQEAVSAFEAGAK